MCVCAFEESLVFTSRAGLGPTYQRDGIEGGDGEVRCLFAARCWDLLVGEVPY